jgi:hypothetical protein
MNEAKPLSIELAANSVEHLHLAVSRLRSRNMQLLGDIDALDCSAREGWGLKHCTPAAPCTTCERDALKAKNADLTRRIRAIATTIIEQFAAHAQHPTIRAEYAALKAEMEKTADG